MIKFCSKCETAHMAGGSCPPRALKAMSEKPATKPPAAPKITAGLQSTGLSELLESGVLTKGLGVQGIPMNELKAVETAPEQSRVVVAEYQYLGEPEPVTGVMLNVPINQPTQFVDRPDCLKCEQKRLKNVEAVKKFRAKNG